MWRDGSTAQTQFTAKRNNKRQRNSHRGMFGLSAFGAEPARRFSSGLMANPELLLSRKIRERGGRSPGLQQNLALTLGSAPLPASVTLPNLRLSQNTEICSQHPTVLCSPWNLIRSAEGRAGARWRLRGFGRWPEAYPPGS